MTPGCKRPGIDGAALAVCLGSCVFTRGEELSEPIMTQQGLWAWFAAAEIFEDVHGMPSTSLCEHRVAEATANARDRLIVLEARLFKGAIGIGTQYFGPLVTVITGRVASGKNVSE